MRDVVVVCPGCGKDSATDAEAWYPSTLAFGGSSRCKECSLERKRQRSRTRVGIIYVARIGEFIKIGFTHSLSQRMWNLRYQNRSGRPAEVDLLDSWPGTMQEEMALHETLSGYRAAGIEWYHDGVLEALGRRNPRSEP